MSAPETIALLRQLLRLKSTPRTGWIDRGVPPEKVESIADHILMTALVGWLTAPGDLDRDKVLKLAIVHDLAEAITGDPPPYNRADVPPPSAPEALRTFFSRPHVRPADEKIAKDLAETEALQSMSNVMPDAIANEVEQLWAEYAEQASPEARFVKDVDRFEAFFQSRSYAEQYPDLPFAGFTAMASQKVTTPVLATLRDALLADEDTDT